ncbi:MAG: DMT family transporter [Lacrimispora sp.]|uniref:DMT family transporter n=1 Tax=Lacrimispora sp. TaxID=2719234 RepID=UPI0039E2437E
MYQFLSFISGILLSVMISVNGSLSDQYGAFTAAVIIHVIGSLFALSFYFLQREKKALFVHRPKWIYLGGAIGVLTTIFSNLAFGHISMTSIIALGLLGQTVASLFIDIFGWFDMERRPFQKTSLFGLAFAVFGVFLMLDNTVATGLTAVFISFASGITVVLSRTVNAYLGKKIGALNGSLVNHLVGLPITVVIALIVTKGTYLNTVSDNGFQIWIYLGGVLGVAAVMLFNIIVPQIPAFQLTMLAFVGQVFTGVLLDVMAGNYNSDTSFLGGTVIAAGIAINMIMERVNNVRERRHQEYLDKVKRTEEGY